MKNLCPDFACLSPHIYRDGFFLRKEDSKKIQRFRCKTCGRYFSSATYSPFYQQKTRRLNAPLIKLLASGVSQRRAAMLLNINHKTVARKLPILGAVCRLKNQTFLKSRPHSSFNVQIDDLITKENSKLKPLSVTIAVDKDRRHILATAISIIPAFGHLSKIALKKYGPRPDQHSEGIDQVLNEIKPYLHFEPLLETDEHQRYPALIRHHFPRGQHKTYRSERACVVGQGELKKVAFDPLFIVNHTCAMLRANVNRLIRKTWCTTKLIERLKDHLDIFTYFYNYKLLPNLPPVPAGNGGS